MPIKWTPDKDQLMLLKLLETHDIKVDVNKIASAWPDQGERPTSRAITERLAKIRKTSKDGGGFGSATPTKAPDTPVKSSPTKRANPSKIASASKRAKSKVKKEDKDSDSDEVDEDEVDGLDTKNIIKEENVDESPARRSARAIPAKINYARLVGAGSGDEGGETADTSSNFGQIGGEDD